MRSSRIPILVLLAALGAPVATAAPVPSASPAATPDRRATAAALFQRGINDVEAGKTAQGCAQLAESVATLPDSGAMGALAECDTALGRLSEAWELWRDLAASAPTGELRDDAAKNAAALDLRLARVALHVRGTAPANLVVTLNDKPVSARAATEYRVVPGALVVAASSPELEPWTKTFRTEKGAVLEIEIPLLPSQDAIRRRARGRTIGVSVAAVGVVALGVGALYGLSASGDWSKATESCGGATDHCKSAGFASAQSQLASARNAATISTWSSIGGAVALASGLIVYLSFRDGPPTKESATAWRAVPVAGPQTVGLVLSRSLP